MPEEDLTRRDLAFLRGVDRDSSRTYDQSRDDDPDVIAVRNDYRWTPACQRLFLEELACTGSVMRSVRHVGKSARSAYGLRFRREGAAFRLGWDAAVLMARAVLSDMLMDRALHGYEEVTNNYGGGETARGKFDNRLSQGLLGRLDRMAEAQATAGSALATIQLVSQDFESFLELIEKGGTGAAAALFASARQELDLSAEEAAIDRELAQISAVEKGGEGAGDEDDDQPGLLDLPPEEAAQQLEVWFDDIYGGWRTNFPPKDAHDAALVTEEGLFGEDDYERSLTDEEEEHQIARLAAQMAPLREAAQRAREKWFGVKKAA